MTLGRRLKRQSESPFESGEAVTLQFEGRTIQGYDNEPVAAALLAAGIRVFGRSIKYHRPRGPVCLRGHCSGCLMRVDGIPNVRTCETLCRSGMVVERQSGWPSSGFDVFRAVDWLTPDRLDHHGMFTASSSVNRLAARFIRKFSGFGEPPTSDPPAAVPLNRFSSEVVVIGGGNAGLSAAMALAESGHEVVLFEASNHRGGRLLDAACCVDDPTRGLMTGWSVFNGWKSKWENTAGIEIHINTPVLAVYGDDHLEVLASNPKQTFLVDAKRLVICCGAYEQIPLFANNDLPGLFGIRALDKLFSAHGVIPGEPLAFVGDSKRTLQLAGLMSDRGANLAGVVTNQRDRELVGKLKSKNIPIFHGRKLVRARGSKWVDRIELAPLDQTAADLVLDCKSCAIEGPPSPAYELAHHAGCRVTFRSSSGYHVVTDEHGRTSHSQIFAAGHCAEAANSTLALNHGQRAGLACAISLSEDAKLSKRLDELVKKEQEADSQSDEPGPGDKHG
jgi:thioredoxin reductase